MDYSDRAKPADSFVDSIGVNVHMSYNGTPYYDKTTQIANILNQLGIRHVRDGHQGARQDQFDKLNILADHGIGVTLIEDPRSDQTLDYRVNELAQGKIHEVDALEGPNEYNTTKAFGDYSWVPSLVQYQQDIYQQNQQYLHLPVYGPSFTNWQSYEQAKEGGLAQWSPIANTHPYPGGQAPTGASSSGDPRWNSSLNWNRVEDVDRLLGAPNSPYVATETGYHNAVNQTSGQPAVPEDVAGIYAPDLFMEYFRQGSIRTFWYELVDEYSNTAKDDPEKNFGLVRNDLTLKPAATAIANMNSLLTDPGQNFAPGILSYSLAGTDSNTRKVLLQKRDGSFWLALWEDASMWDTSAKTELNPASKQVTLTLASPANMAVYRPNDGTGLISSATNTTTLTVDTSAKLSLVKISGASIPAPTIGDINGDQKVDIFDLSILLSSYGQPKSAASSPVCDINNDNNVDVFDLSILLSHYGG